MQDGVVHVPRTFFKAIIFIFNVFIIKFDMRFMGAISSHIRFTLCRFHALPYATKPRRVIFVSKGRRSRACTCTCTCLYVFF